MLEQFEFGLNPAPREVPGFYFLFQGAELLWSKDSGAPPSLAPAESASWHAQRGLPQPDLPIYFGSWQQTPCYVVGLDSQLAAPEGYEWQPLRQLLLRQEQPWAALAGRGRQLLEFAQTHRFCGRCAAATVAAGIESARCCPVCNASYYPRIAPCIIVLVSRGDEVLLARGNRHAADTYSTLAGFVEAGETLEQAVRREVFEEVGLSLGALQYAGSQPWPFPSQLMLGFQAEYGSGEICVDGEEIIDAQWWRYDRLPLYPGEGTIAGRLIREYLQRRGGV